uniref:MATE family efflux transporter n=1 Tax=Sulfurivirga sp. TaxID=2614236 RepID=UPI0025D8F10A
LPHLVTDATVEALARQYLWLGLPSLILAAVHFPLRFIWEGLGRVRLTVLTSLIMFLVNIPLDVFLVLGIGPYDGLGGAGCGLATTVSLLLGVLFSIWLVRRDRHLKMLLAPGRIQGRQFRQLLAVGSPAATALLLEVSLFMLLALLVAPMGVQPLSAHQIALNVTSVLYVVPFSLALAVSIETGRLRAEADAVQLRQFALRMLSLAALTGAGLSVVTWLLHDRVPTLFTTDERIRSLAASLLLYAVAYQVGDALQMTAAGILRAFGRTRSVLAATLVAYWGIGLGGGSWLAWYQEWGVRGYWLALAVGLTTAGVVLTLYLSSSSFWRKNR